MFYLDVVMKARVFFYFLIFPLVINISCSRDNGPEEGGGLVFIESLPGGCNGVEFGQIKSLMEGPDTVYFDVKNDTLAAFVGINYICCAPFATETYISNDSIFMTIKDTCPDPMSCYCKCMCYYSWDFLFSEIEEKEYYYQVVLIDPRQDGPQVLREGVLDLSGE